MVVIITEKSDENKKRIYIIIRRINRIISDLKCDRCPDLARNCCSACVRFKLFAKDLNKELMNDDKEKNN